MCRGRRLCSVGVHQTAETADMARLAEPPALPHCQGVTLGKSPVLCQPTDLCVDTAWTLVSHSFYLELEVSLKSLQDIQYKQTHILTVEKAGETFWSWCCCS